MSAVNPGPSAQATAVRQLRTGALSAVHGLAIALLSLAVHPVLFAAALSALLLLPAAGLGFALFPLVVMVTRQVLNAERALAGWSGAPIAKPYRPRPEARLSTWSHFRWVVSDPATWLDLAWLVPGAVAGGVFGLLAFGITAYGLEGVLMVPGLMYRLEVWYGYGPFWPVDNPAKVTSAWLLGVLIFAAGLVAAPWLMWLHSRFASFFLAPVRSTALTERVRELTSSRADTVDAQAAELRRIERDLHDGAQARLVSLGMSIGLAEELMIRDPQAAAGLLAEAREASGQALVELRELVRGIHPPVLAERGLAGAVHALVLTLPIPVEVSTTIPGRLAAPVESAMYFAVAEVLANVGKHSGADAAWLRLEHTGTALTAVIGDDGRGGADPTGEPVCRGSSAGSAYSMER